MGNVNLAAAKRAKNDEFYTRREDIENELMHYRDHFTGKTVYCNCDDPVTSEFWKFFQRNFSAWGLKCLIATHYYDLLQQHLFAPDKRVSRFTHNTIQHIGRDDSISDVCNRLNQ